MKGWWNWFVGESELAAGGCFGDATPPLLRGAEEGCSGWDSAGYEYDTLIRIGNLHMNNSSYQCSED